MSDQHSTSRQPLGALIAADAISRAGNGITAIAIPWFVLITTGSPARTGLVVFATALPVVLSLFFGGVLVDRLSYRRASIVGDLASGATVAMIPLLHLLGVLAFWHILVLAFLGALLDLPAEMARYSALPDLAKLGGVRFERANAVFDGAITVASLAAPATAGVLIGLIGATNVLWLDVATFATSAALMAIGVPASASPAPDPASVGNYRRELTRGLRFVRDEPVLFPLVLFFAAMNLFIGPIDTLIVPVYAREVLDSSVALGLMAAAGGVGALGGNVLFGWLGHRLSRRAVFCAGFLGVPLALGALALTPGLVVAIVILALLGLALSLTNLLEYTIYFERIPDGMRARVLGLAGAMGWGSVPLGRILGGLLLDRLGLPATLALLAVLALPLPLAMFAVGAFRRLEAPAGVTGD